MIADTTNSNLSELGRRCRYRRPGKAWLQGVAKVIRGKSIGLATTDKDPSAAGGLCGAAAGVPSTGHLEAISPAALKNFLYAA